MSGAPGTLGDGGWPTPPWKSNGRQDAIDPEASGPSSRQQWLWYCHHCCQFTTDFMSCHDAKHLLEDLGQIDQDIAQTSIDLEISQSNAWSSDMSRQMDTSPLFSTHGTTESSNTGGSYFGTSIELQQAGQQVFSSQDSGYGAATSYTGQDGPQGNNVAHQSCGLQIASLGQAALETLDFWRNRCCNERRSPSERELEGIANLENLDIHIVRSWFATNLILPQAPISAPTQPAHATQAPVSHASDRDKVIAEVTAYATKCNNRACENSQSRKASQGTAQKAFPCCLGCSFSTDDKDTWDRHHKNKFPQEFWHCVLCRNTDRRFICHRKYHMRPHLNGVHSHHPAVQQGRHGEIRDQSHVPFSAPYPTTCPLSTRASACDKTFSSWAEFVQHCLDHLKTRISHESDGPWTSRYKRQDPFDDEDDNQGPSRSTSSNAAMGQPNHVASSKRSDARTITQTRSRNMDGQSSYSSSGQSVRLAPLTKPKYVIDVHCGELVKTPVVAKYLALEYSWASRECPQARQIPSGKTLTKAGHDLWANEVPLPFRKAMALTREMGYRYLWIDALCEDASDPLIRTAVYEHALFIIVVVSMDESRDRIWHFTCDYRNLDVVLSWFEPSVSGLPFIHVQNLGHGAYGIVDEVQLRTTHESFARKVCTRKRDDERALDLQEIEILQKFNHDNIPRFIAAYYQKQSLNILMLPVAECNLKEYLREPTAYDKRPYMQEWYYSLASVVDYMHGLSCRHKDIKPANILISGTKVLLSDFGTSLDFSLDSSKSTGPGCMTPKYCAPEVAECKSRGRKADIFSLGCVFVEMVTVDVGLPLSSLSRFLGFHTEPRNASSVYHQHIERLKQWLVLLRSRAYMAHQGLVLQIADKMIAAQPRERPSAREVSGKLWAVLPAILGQGYMFTSRFNTNFWAGSTYALTAVLQEHEMAYIEPLMEILFRWSEAILRFEVMTGWLPCTPWDMNDWEIIDTTCDLFPVTGSAALLQKSDITTALADGALTRDSRVARGFKRLKKLVRIWLAAARGCRGGTRMEKPAQQNVAKIIARTTPLSGTKDKPRRGWPRPSPNNGLSLSYGPALQLNHEGSSVRRTWKRANREPFVEHTIWKDDTPRFKGCLLAHSIGGVVLLKAMHFLESKSRWGAQDSAGYEQQNVRCHDLVETARRKDGNGYEQVNKSLDTLRKRADDSFYDFHDARASEADWVWVDSDCADKTSTAEHSETTNSISDWHSSDFWSSTWVQRGWTLQELLCSAKVAFPLHNSLQLRTNSDRTSSLMLNMPKARSNAFYGREDVLMQLGKNLRAGSRATAVMHGIGGIGKSQVAMEYAYRLWHAYDAVLWIQADDAGNLHKSFIQIATTLGLVSALEADRSSDAHRSRELVKDWLRSPQRHDHWSRRDNKWLLVFDNVEDPDSLHDFWPSEEETQCSILITSRNRDLAGALKRNGKRHSSMEVEEIELKPFTEVEATTALKGLAGVSSDHEDDVASKLSALLGYLPLAIAQAATLIRDQRMTLADFLAKFETVHIGVLLNTDYVQCDPLREKLIVQNTRRLVNHHDRSNELNRHSSACIVPEERFDRSEALLQILQKRIIFSLKCVSWLFCQTQTE